MEGAEALQPAAAGLAQGHDPRNDVGQVDAELQVADAARFDYGHGSPAGFAAGRKNPLSTAGVGCQVPGLLRSSLLLSFSTPHLLTMQKETWEDFWKVRVKELLEEISPIRDYTGKEIELWFRRL